MTFKCFIQKLQLQTNSIFSVIIVYKKRIEAITEEGGQHELPPT